jgi:hypothetical protein
MTDANEGDRDDQPTADDLASIHAMSSDRCRRGAGGKTLAEKLLPGGLAVSSSAIPARSEQGVCLLGAHIAECRVEVEGDGQVRDAVCRVESLHAAAAFYSLNSPL